MKHVDMRSLTAEAQEERRRQVIGLRQAGQTYAAIAAQVGLTPTGVFDICKRFAARLALRRLHGQCCAAEAAAWNAATFCSGVR